MPSAMLTPSLRRMIEPLPYSFSMVATARSIALVLFLGSSMTVLGLGKARRGGLAGESLTGNPFSFQLLSLMLALTALAQGCNSPEHRPDSTGLPPLASGPADLPGVAKLLGLDAGELEVTPVDPPAPAGDLKADIDRFTSIDACALERARLDPLLGDALEAIGYDTFLRDACRVIDAAKAKDASRCAGIDASSLEARCRATVAEVAGTPDACPWEAVTRPTRGREPRCLAVASRDARLCAAVADPVERATCQATVARDDGPCARLTARTTQSRCIRDADRWHGVLASEGPHSNAQDRPLAVTGRLHVDPMDPVNRVNQSLDVDLAPDLALGVTVVEQRDGVRFVVGPLSESGLDFIAPSPHVRGSLALELFASVPRDRGPGDARRGRGPGDAPRSRGPENEGTQGASVVIERAELVVPGRPPLATPGGAQSTLTAKLDRFDGVRASPVALVVDGDISAAGSSWRVHAEAM